VEAIMKTDLVQGLQDKRAEIHESAVRNGANDIRVFGSIARGDAQDGSHIDFLVEVEKGRSALDR
jgi:predicted nucleotidyltransferase